MSHTKSSESVSISPYCTTLRSWLYGVRTNVQSQSGRMPLISYVQFTPGAIDERERESLGEVRGIGHKHKHKKKWHYIDGGGAHVAIFVVLGLGEAAINGLDFAIQRC